MNRPRNRQPRGARQGQQNTSRSGPSSRGSSQGSPATPQQAAGTVPTVQQVIPGAAVFIVLKEDQPTGKETAGVVGELLTNGNHPRGIKVRLQNGQVGRVQRMGHGPEPSTGSSESESASIRPIKRSVFSSRYTDVRNDLDYPSEPPPRSLADFLPPMGNDVAQDQHYGLDDIKDYVEIKCPFCDAFTGDEAAVTHHIDREHLT